jgi:DNA-binding CsgD family transcriptional regulator
LASAAWPQAGGCLLPPARLDGTCEQAEAPPQPDEAVTVVKGGDDVEPVPDTAGTGSGVAALSSREHEAARLVAAAKTNKEIAVAFYLSEKTIESHLARIYEKLDVHSRAGLTARLVREGAG